MGVLTRACKQWLRIFRAAIGASRAACFCLDFFHLRIQSSLREFMRAYIKSSRVPNCASSAWQQLFTKKGQIMKKIVLALAIAILGLSSMTAPAAYANGAAHSSHGAQTYYVGHAPAKAFYRYVPGQTTTFFNGYVPGFGYTHDSVTIYYNGYAPYPYGGRWWWQRPWPSAPAASW